MCRILSMSLADEILKKNNLIGNATNIYAVESENYIVVEYSNAQGEFSMKAKPGTLEKIGV